MADITRFLQKAVDRAEQAGVDPAKIILDPGIGFGKTVDHNLTLVRKTAGFAALDKPILIGASRKAFIRTILSNEFNEEMNPLSPEVAAGSQAMAAAAAWCGAHIVRVHDVKSTRAALAVVDALMAG